MAVSAVDKRRQLIKTLQERFEGLGCSLMHEHREVTMQVPNGVWKPVALALKDDPNLHFEQLIDLCGLDYAAYGRAEWSVNQGSTSGFARGAQRVETTRMTGDEQLGRFVVVAHLLSLRHNWRIRCKVAVNEQSMLDTVTDVWTSADWFERETFDMFGILFAGHMDLRRILTDYGFVGHPLRKDFPLSGEVEMRYDPIKQRVVYEPVRLDERVLVPRVIRPTGRE